MARRWIEGLLRALAVLPAALPISLLPVGAGANPPRVTNGLVAFYPFTEGVGIDVDDHAPDGLPDPLIATGKLAWLAGSGENGIDLQGGRVGTPHLPGEPTSSLPVIAALKATGTSTFELWIDPASLTEHDADNRIFSVGSFSIRQIDDDLEIRLRHTGKSAVGKPWLVTNNAALPAGLTHLVHTFDGSIERLYIDGVAHPTTVVDAGTYANWNTVGRLAFGTRADVDYNSLYLESWHGSVRLAAVYDRALTPAEVTQNFAAGPDLPLVSAGPDRATQGFPGHPTQSVTLGGSVPGAPTVAASWSVLSGPPGGIVSFDDPSQPDTGAQFSQNGIYELLLTANDGSSLASDRVRVAVNVLSSQITAPQNVFPASAAVDVANAPTLEIACDASVTGARFVIARDPAFTNIVHDSGESSNYTCSYVVLTGLQGNAVHYWSARVRDAQGDWSDWSTPSQFTTARAASITTLSLRQGVDGYTGAGDADIRGFASDPFNPVRIWNQGAQDVLRTGRRPIADHENCRSLLRFEIDGIADPNSVINAYLELTGYQHEEQSDFFFEASNSFYEMLVPWGEGTGLTRAPQPGEVSWLHSVYPTIWNFPGAGGVGSDRAAQALMRGKFRGEVGHKTFWSSQAFLEAVRGWIANPAANHGFLLQADDEVALEILNLASKEHADPTWRPRLVLELIDRDEIADTVLIGHGNGAGVVSRYDAQTGQSEVALDLSAPSRDVAADAEGNIYTTREVFIGPGFETHLSRDGVVVDTFPGAPGGLAVDLVDASVLVAHGDASGVVSRYDPSTGQSSAVLALSAPTHDVAVGPSGDIYTTREVFVGPGFETDLSRDGVVVDTFSGAPGGLAFDASTDTVLVGHGDAGAVVSRYNPDSGQSNPVLSLGAIIEDVAVNSTGDIFTTSEIPSGPGFDTRLLENGSDADVLPGAPGGLAVVPLPEPGAAALFAGLSLLFALRRHAKRRPHWSG